MEVLKGIFTGAADSARVNPAGLILMAAAVIIVLFAAKIARRINPGEPERIQNITKITGLIICAGGALLAILG